MTRILAALFFAFALTASAADVTGRWTGTADLTAPQGTESGGALFQLKQSGQIITGTAGPDEERQMPIQKGRIEGNKVTLELSMTAENETRIVTIALTLKGEDKMDGRLEFDVPDGKVTGKLAVARQK